MQGALPPEPENKKLAHLLEVAMDVFIRFGFKKTSMGDIAQAAEISRQGLYFHFKTKEALFAAAMEYSFEAMRRDVDRALADPKKPLEKRLLDCFDVTMGRWVGRTGGKHEEFVEVSEKLTGDLIDRAFEELKEILAKNIDEAMVRDLTPGGEVGTKDRVATLLAAAMGMKHSVDTRDEFRKGMQTAIRVVLAPLKLRGKAAT